MPYSALDSNRPYVSQQAGWRAVFVALLIAAILGLSFRVYFSPRRIKGWIEAELQKQPAKIELKFKSAELRLARGMLPQLAVRLTDVEGRSVRSCASSPGFRVSEIYIPFRIIPLFEGKVSVGTVHGGSVAVDLDALRDRCETAGASGAHGGKPKGAVPAVAVAPSGETGAATGGGRPWWTPEQLRTVKNLVGGLSFESLELRFERGAKFVVFQDLSVRANAGPDAVFVAADVKVPPDLLFGQTFAPFALKATVRSDAADVEVKGSLAEGGLNGRVALASVPGDVAIDARLRASSVPLSALLPFARRAGWFTREMHPRFLWLQCEVSVRGRARRLFQDNPLSIEKCALEGEGGRIAVEKAVIGPEGRISPFEIALAGVDIERWLTMFGERGPSGVMSRFGRLSGRGRVAAAADIEFEGSLVDAQLLFSRRSVRAQQLLPEIRGRIARKGERWNLSIEDIQLAGGAFGGRIAFDAAADLRSGALDVEVRELRFHPEVEQLLIGGGWRAFSLVGEGGLADGRLAGFKGELNVKGVEAKDVRFTELAGRVYLDGPRARIDAAVAAGEIRNGARVLALAAPVFLDHRLVEDWIPFKGAFAQISLQDRDLSWEKSSLSLRNGQIRITSAGIRRDDGTIGGWVGADYPKLKQLRWDLDGEAVAPRLVANDRTRRETEGREWSDAALGVLAPAVKAKPKPESGVPEDVGLRRLGERVLERAKSILPKIESKIEDRESR